MQSSEEKECSLKRYVITLLALNEEIPELSRTNKIRCISSNHEECFEACIEEFGTEENMQRLIVEACQVGDFALLHRINKKKEIRSFMKITHPYSLETTHFLREELGLQWSKNYIKNCFKGAEYEAIKYALEDGCTCVPWRLKMLLHVYKKEMKNDEWMQKLFASL